MLKFLLFLVVLGGIWPGVKAAELDTVYMKFTSNISRLEFSNDDSKILTVGSGGIIIFDTQTGTQLKQLPDGDGEYSEDGTQIAGIQQIRDSTNKITGYNIHVYSAVNYLLVKTIPLPQFANEEFAELRLSPDAQTIA